MENNIVVNVYLISKGVQGERGAVIFHSLAGH